MLITNVDAMCEQGFIVESFMKGIVSMLSLHQNYDKNKKHKNNIK